MVDLGIMTKRCLWVVAAVSSLQAFAVAAATGAEQGLAMRAEPKYRPGFQAYDYANPEAPKGGALVIGQLGTFDSVNPFALKGVSLGELDRLVFQELGDSSHDEPFTQYPGLAAAFVLAPDHLEMTISLRPEARFSDGKPVTAEDVVFSFNTFKSDQVVPLYRFYWADIKSVTAVDAHTVKMQFARENPELPLIATQLPVLPKHVYGEGRFSTDFAGRAVGSGPYVVAEVHPGSSLVLRRNPEFWGRNLGPFKGRFNFDQITVKLYKDPTAMVEGFKKGDFDVYAVNMAKVWALELTGDKIDKYKYIKKDLLPNANDLGAQGFVFNLRLPIFQDVRVRQAIALAFDFDWSNKNLFYGQYERSHSFFENSPLKATGMPAAEELTVLEPLRGDLPPEVFTKPVGWLDQGAAAHDITARLRQAAALLKEAGFQIRDGVAQGAAGRLEFKFLVSDSAFQRVIEPFVQNLAKIGVVVGIETKEQSVYTKRLESREFAMTNVAMAQSLSPGNEQRNYWTTAAATENHSRNFAGIKNPGVDALVDRIIYAKTRHDLELATRCLDRALYHLHPMVHNWHLAHHRFAYWDKFGRPAHLPTYYSLPILYEFMWFDAAKAARLEQARANQTPIP